MTEWIWNGLDAQQISKGIMNCHDEQRETTVKGELRKTRTDIMELTQANQGCSLLSALDDQKSITSVSPAKLTNGHGTETTQQIRNDQASTRTPDEFTMRVQGSGISHPNQVGCQNTNNKMNIQAKELRETTVKGELLTTRESEPEERKQTPATPRCSSLSALDVSLVETTTNVSLTQPEDLSRSTQWYQDKWNMEYELLAQEVEVAFKRNRRNKKGHFDLRKWARNLTTFLRPQGPYSYDQKEIAILALIQGAWYLNTTLSINNQVKVEQVLEAASLCLGDGILIGHGISIYGVKTSTVKPAKFLTRIINKDMRLLYLYHSIGGSVLKPSQFCRTHILRQILGTLVEPITRKFKISDTTRKILNYESTSWTDPMFLTYDQLQKVADSRLLRVEVQALFSIEHNITSTTVTTIFEKVKEYVANALGSLCENAWSYMTAMCVVVLLWNVFDYLCSAPKMLSKVRTFFDILQGILTTMMNTYIVAKFAMWIGIAINEISKRQEQRRWDAHPRMNEGPLMSSLRVENQAGAPQNSVLGALALASLTLLSGKEVTKPENIIKQVSQLPRFTMGVTSLVEAFGDVYKILHKHILEDIFGYPAADESGTHPDMERFNLLMTLITGAARENKIQNSSILQAHVVEAEQLGLRILQSPGLKDCRSALLPQYQILRQIIARLGLHGSSKNQRLAPVIVMLYGKTGQGKSSCITTLATKLLSKICETEGIDKTTINTQDMIYARNQEQEFWDGYHGQVITVYDDFAQQRDFAQTPNLELFEVIRAGNTFPYPLHMADIADKNTTTFQSRIVLLTTNNRKPKIESLYAPEAVYRRIDCAFEVAYDDEKSEIVTINGVQCNRLLPEFAHQYDPANQTFQKYDVCTTENEGQPLSLDQVVDMAFAKYRQRFAFERTRQMYDQQLQEACGFRRVEPQIGWVQSVCKKIFHKTPEPSVHYTNTYLTFGDDGEVIRHRRDSEEVFIDPVLLHELQIEQENWLLRWNGFKQRLSQKVSEFAPLLKCLGLLGLLVGTCMVGKSLLKMFGGNARSVVEKEMYTPQPRVKRIARESAYNPGFKAAKKAVTRTTRVTQEVADDAARNLSASLGAKSIYSISVGEHTLGCGLFVVGKVFLFPRHFIQYVKMAEHEDPDAEIVLRNQSVHFTIKVSDWLDTAMFIEQEGEDRKDIAVVVIPTAFDHKNRINSFATEADQSRLSDIGVNLCKVEPLSPTTTGFTVFSCPAESVWRIIPKDTEEERAPTLVAEDEEGKDMYCKDYWRYRIPTRKGDCGSVLVANSNVVARKIIGMHTMGAPGRDDGFSVPLTQEEIQELVDMVQPDKKVEPPEIMVERQITSLPFSGEFLPIGTSKEVHRTPTKSKIVPSLLHPENTSLAWREPVSKPTLLHPIVVRDEDGMPFETGTRFDPMAYRLSKCGMPAKCVKQQLLDRIVEQRKQELSCVLSARTNANYKSESTFEEAVLGIDGDPYVNSIDRSTAAGYRWIPEQGKPGKTTWFGDTDKDYDMTKSGEVQERVSETIALARENKRNDHIFIDTLKDERKPIQKAWKTRVFSACPMDYYIACKMYYQGIVGWMARNRIATSVAVGINVYSAEWDMIVQHLHQYSSHMVAGDFENFDATELTQVLTGARDVYNHIGQQLPDWKPEHDQIRNVLFEDLIHSIHLCGDLLYAWTHSLPSGHYLTANINSEYVILCFRYLIAKALLSRGLELSEILPQLLQFKMITYGDDHIISIPSEYIDLFNQETFPKLFAEIGMGYTDEQKDNSRKVANTRPITNVTFLKRSFRFDRSVARYVAPLTLDTVLETPLWQAKTEQPMVAAKSTVAWACDELAMHDDEVYATWTNKIRLVCKDVLHWMPILSLTKSEYIHELSKQYDSVGVTKAE